PPPASVKPCGGVYEHSPWIAEAVYDARLRPAHDGVKGLHTAMVEAVETAPRERRLELLRAHPDLAGRLAIRGELTPASTAEQASARLDACTIEEYDRFQALNAEFTRKFGFPFIMAVRGRNRQEILVAFEQRIHNEPEAGFRSARHEV